MYITISDILYLFGQRNFIFLSGKSQFFRGNDSVVAEYL